jgi:hypothetical protein
MATFKSCYHCKERYLGCHDKCNKYLKEKANWEETKQIIAKNKAPVLTSYIFDRIAYNNYKRRK